MRAIFTGSDELTPQIRTFWFKPEKPLRFTAGQFTELTIKHDNPDERGEKHWFTLSSSPTDEQVSITTKYAGDDKSSSFKKALFALEPGAEVDMAEAMGDFVLPKSAETPLVFVAGGIGLTPFHSIAKWLADTGETRDIRMLYAVNTEDDIIFQDDFEKAGIKLTIIVGNPSDEWGGLRGRLDAETILGVEEPSGDTLVYLSGPEPMVESLQVDLESKGIDKRQIVGDFFPGYTSI